MTPNWFRFSNVASDPTVAEIYIIDFIGDWIDQAINEMFQESISVTAKAFVDQLAALPEAVTSIRVHINSPGGDVFAALNIANALRDQQVTKGRAVQTIIDGLAASAASIIAMAGQSVTMADNALMMIHNPWSFAMGEAGEMRKQADTLDTVRGTIVATYQWHSTLDAAAIVALMDAETWMTADEAIASGFATEKVAGLKAAAAIRPKAMARLTVPAAYRERVDALILPPTPAQTPPPAPEPVSAESITRACAAAGLDLEFATALIAERPTAAALETRVAGEQGARTAAKQRGDEITALCRVAKTEPLAAGLIAGAMSVDAVRAHLTIVTALLDKVEIDASLRPDDNGENVKQSWAAAFARVQGRKVAH